MGLKRIKRARLLTFYTLVQHSGFGYAGDPTFQHAVETRSVSDVEAELVLKIGGVILPSYMAAEERAEEENYPAEVNGLVPRVRGMFSSFKVDGLRIYISGKEA